MLRRKNRISKDFFRNTSREVKNLSSFLLTIRAVKNLPQEEARFAVIVSKKVARTAVSRNKIRRKVYGAIGPSWPARLKGFLFFIYPKKDILVSSHSLLEDSLKEAFKEMGF